MLEINNVLTASQPKFARWFRLIFAVIAIALLVTLSACDGANTENITSVKLSVLASVNWDKDSEADGVQFALRPLDDYGLLVKGNCTINAKVWLQQSENSSEKRELIQEWQGISISKKDYNKYGADVRLQYIEFIPLPPDNGILWVEAIMPDGRSFSFQESNVRLGYYNLMNIKKEVVCGPTGCATGCSPQIVK